MTENEIKAFSQPSWELYKDMVLSVPGKDNGDVEGKPVYDYYHEKVMAGDYGDVTIFFIKDKPKTVKEQVNELKPKISRYIFATEDEPDKPDWDELVEVVPNLIGPILLENELITEEDLQYCQDQIDWGATLNDVLVYLEDTDKIVFYNCILN